VSLSLSGGVDQARLTAISGGEKLDLKDFSVQVIKASTAYSLGTAENGNQVGGKYPARCQVRFSETFRRGRWNCLEGFRPHDGTTTMVLLEPLLCLCRALIREFLFDEVAGALVQKALNSSMDRKFPKFEIRLSATFSSSSHLPL
jgi:hypothetical protein